MNLKTLVCSLVLLSSSLTASEWMAEVRGDYFYPTYKRFQKIYRQGGMEGGIELSKKFCDNWLAFEGLSYFEKSGHSIGLNDRTRIKMVPFSFGVKYLIPTSFCFTPYIGLGATYTFIYVRNHSDFVKRRVNKSSFGFVAKSGAHFDLSERVLLDVFVDYYYQSVHFYNHHTNDVGGLKMGVGLGYKF